MSGLELPLLTLVALVGAAFAAGWVDSIVGGGGLIQLPALLIGLPESTPVPTIAGTNKVASSMGTAVASATYLRSVRIDWWGLLPLVAGSALGSALGAQLTHLVDRRAFTPLVLGAIVTALPLGMHIVEGVVLGLLAGILVSALRALALSTRSVRNLTGVLGLSSGIVLLSGAASWYALDLMVFS